MAVPMRSTDFRSVVEPILNETFDGRHKRNAEEWKQVYAKITGTKRAYHEEPVLYGFGAAPEMAEGAPVTYDAGGVLFIQRYMYKVYGLAFALTKVLVEDGDHIRLGKIYSEHLADSLSETKETIGANKFNRAFNASYVGGDGVAMNHAAHPTAPGRTGGATYSNLLGTAAALSQTSLEQMVIQTKNAVDDNGKRIRLQPKCIVSGSSNCFQAEVLLNSVLRTGDNKNDLNPIKSLNLFPEGSKTLSRITSNFAWWIQTDAPRGLQYIMRRELERSMEGDFETDSMRYKATERYVMDYTNPRCTFGTPGI